MKQHLPHLKISNFKFQIYSRGFTPIIIVIFLAMILAAVLVFAGGYIFKLPFALPNQTKTEQQIANGENPTISVPVEDPEECDDQYNADCEDEDIDLEDLTPEEIKALTEED